MRPRSTLVVGFFVFVCGALVFCAAQSAAARNGARYDRAVAPLLRKYCVGCHGPERRTAGVDFLTFRDETGVLQARALWERVAINVGTQVMPPMGMPHPTQEERDRIVSWINATLEKVDCDLRDPGRVTLRRLNRAEYNNTLRDLFGIDLRPADDFPSDDVGYGFDNIGDVLSISPLLMEKYLTAAEKVVRAATVAPEDRLGPARRFEAERTPETGGDGIPGDWYRTLTSSGEAFVEFAFPNDGDYLLRVQAFGQQAGPDPARMALRLDGKDLQTLDVPVREDAPRVYEIRLPVQAGTRRFGAAFLNDYYQPDDPDPKNRDRNLVIDYFEIVGPIQSGPVELPESHRRIFICQPTGPNDRADCAGNILANFARRAYRRPVAAEEVVRLVRYVDLAEKEGESFERGIQLALQAVLVSPHFLFRVEPEPADSKASRPLNDYELASRLSYFLWSSMPDEELFSLAEKGRLHSSRALEEQVRRMLRDPRAQALVENFGEQWLTLRNLQTFSPDPKRFPTFNEPLRAAMLTETRLFLGAIIRDGGSVLDVLDADFTFLNEPLARHYGIDGVAGDQFRQVNLTRQQREQRGGILGQASVLAVTSNPTRTSPVKRGLWVLDALLGTPPPPPPPGVPELEAERAVALTGTLRQRMEQHRQDPMCATCHNRMDPLGFALENYDAVGAWRTQDDGLPVDSSGTLPTGESFNGPAQLRRVLLRQKKVFVRAVTEKMLTYALGRGLEKYDRCTVDDIARRVASKGYRFTTLIHEIVKCEPFRLRRGG